MILNDLTKEFNKLELGLKTLEEMGGGESVPKSLIQELLKRTFRGFECKKGVKLFELQKDSSAYWVVVISVDGRSLDQLDTIEKTTYSFRDPNKTKEVLEEIEDKLAQEKLRIQHKENLIGEAIEYIDKIIRNS